MAKNGKQAGPKPAKVESHPEVAEPVLTGQGAVRAAFKPDGKGGGTLQLRYSGQLAGYDVVWVRLGERRHGADWLQTRDVKMDKAEGQAVARFPIGPGEPLEGASFAFFAAGNGQGEPVWDNAGRPFGCYTLDARSGAVAPS